MEADEGQMPKVSGDCASPGSSGMCSRGDEHGDEDRAVGRGVVRAMSPEQPQLRQESEM